MAYTYRSAYTYEYVDTNRVLMDGGLNPLPGVTAALNEWSEKGYEVHSTQYEFSDQFHVSCFITFRKES
ncbi:MAG: hypothetical protein ABIO06_01510 [Pseudolysinimonas sp.]